MEQLGPIFEEIMGAHESGGIIAAVAVAVMALVRIFRTDAIQGLLPDKGKWANWPTWAKIVAPFSVAAVGQLVMSLAVLKVSVPAAILAAFTTGVGAIVAHKGTKRVAKSMAKVAHKNGVRVRKTPVDIVVPLSSEYMKQVRKDVEKAQPESK